MLDGFEEHFGEMTDPRVERSKLHPLKEILFVLLCGTICGAESWRDFVTFGQDKLDLLREYYPFEAGIPSKNTFARVCAAIDPEQFRSCFIAWAASLHTLPAQVLALDGETVAGYVGSQTVLDETDMMNIAVHPDFRRKGVARGLILALIGELKKRGSRCLTLEVRASNDPARALYESLGFAHVGTRRNYYQNPKEDALILRKEWEI